MAYEKADQRVRYTKMVIKNSLLELMRERSISKVTVTDICKKANINRNTFYSHYANQFELLSIIEDELYEEIRQVVGRTMNLEAPGNLSYEICKYIKANRNICEVLFSENGNKDLLERILYISHDFNIEKWKNEAKHIDQKSIDNWYTFTAYGSIAVIEKWVNSGMKESPSKIAAFIDKATQAIPKY
ncbi:TetR/AcrR family transcriptional regulator [Lacrimispora aerotolerans]|jgi:AcrR family transcriptional regulator|uniref:TetR/AcrR family transcriptional regulator n=1 Tax=Lacrimispora aerotolerans TaxID=36832 RepID=UPI000AB650CB|nr:TetR/AcrR family transcriptional regulator [Lacrimispora aerotolerans]